MLNAVVMAVNCVDVRVVDVPKMLTLTIMFDVVVGAAVGAAEGAAVGDVVGMGVGLPAV